MASTAKQETLQDIELQDGDTVQLKDVLRIVEFYKTNIRPHSRREELGTFKQLKRAFEAGITPQQVWTAMRNYQADPLRIKAKDAMYIKTMRSFFSVASLQQWQKPRELPKVFLDPAEQVLNRLDEAPPPPTPAPILPPPAPVEDATDDDFFRL